jgi:hypothetical protein
VSKKIFFKKYVPNRFDADRFFGVVFYTHPKYKGVEIFFGKSIYEIWTGYKR